MNWKISSFLLLLNVASTFATSCKDIKKVVDVTLCKDDSSGKASIL